MLHLAYMGLGEHNGWTPGTEIYRFEWPYVEEAENLVNRGHQLGEMGRYAEATRCLRKALDKAPFLMDAYVGLGVIALRKGRPDSARDLYTKAFDLGYSVLPTDFTGLLSWYELPNRPFLRAVHGLGLSLLELGDRSGAERIFRLGLMWWPNDNIGMRFLVKHLEAGLDPIAMEELIEAHYLITDMAMPGVEEGIFGLHDRADAFTLTWERRRRNRGEVMVHRFAKDTLEPSGPFAARFGEGLYREWADEHDLDSRYGITSGRPVAGVSVLVDVLTNQISLLDTNWWRAGGMAMLHQILKEMRTPAPRSPKGTR